MCDFTGLRHCRRRLTGAALVTLFIWLCASAAQAQEMGPVVAGEGALLKWAIAQGGPSVLVIVLGWSYRRDLMGVISEKEEIIEVLTDLVKRNTEANEHLSAAVDALTVEVRRR